jgi:hypothetical protein
VRHIGGQVEDRREQEDDLERDRQDELQVA